MEGGFNIGMKIQGYLLIAGVFRSHALSPSSGLVVSAAIVGGSSCQTAQNLNYHIRAPDFWKLPCQLWLF